LHDVVGEIRGERYVGGNQDQLRKKMARQLAQKAEACKRQVLRRGGGRKRIGSATRAGGRADTIQNHPGRESGKTKKQNRCLPGEQEIHVERWGWGARRSPLRGENRGFSEVFLQGGFIWAERTSWEYGQRKHLLRVRGGGSGDNRGSVKTD